MPRRDQPPAPPARAAWRRALDVAVFGAAALAASIQARYRRDQRSASGQNTHAMAAENPGAQSARGWPAVPPAPGAAQQGYETEDMHAPAMVLVLLGLALFVAVFSGAVIAMTDAFHGWNRNHPAFTSEQTARITPPAPHLQPDPYATLRAERARQAHLLHSYAWLNAQHTAARIPIDRAMALTVGKSLDAGP